MKLAATLVFIVGIGVAGVFASRVVPPDVPEGQQATPSARIGAWWGAAGPGFSIGALMMIGGGLAARRLRRSASAPGEETAGDTATSMLAAIRERLEALPEHPANAIDATREGLDEVLEQLVPRFLDRREAMIDEFGLGTFAEMIGHFSAMERNAARAWSALIDEAYDEVPGCLDRARQGVARASAVLEGGAS